MSITLSVWTKLTILAGRQALDAGDDDLEFLLPTVKTRYGVVYWA